MKNKKNKKKRKKNNNKRAGRTRTKRKKVQNEKNTNKKNRSKKNKNKKSTTLTQKKKKRGQLNHIFDFSPPTHCDCVFYQGTHAHTTNNKGEPKKMKFEKKEETSDEKW